MDILIKKAQFAYFCLFLTNVVIRKAVCVYELGRHSLNHNKAGTVFLIQVRM